MDTAAEKSDKAPLSMVAVDGPRCRAIREEKRLTQLYVANVVGVTTDTISRWENNRYPSIKRENAEKLAAALEVALETILRQEEPESVPETPAPSSPRGRRLLVVVLVVVAFAVAGVIGYRMHVTSFAVTRWLPRFTPPGEVVPVLLKITRRDAGQEGFIVRERLPQGWRFVAASPPPAPEPAAGGELKWLIPGGSGPVTICYTVVPPAATFPKGSAAFSGTAVVHSGEVSRTEAIGGSRSVTLAPYHWADANGDGRVDDNEIMPAYYLTEEMKGLGLAWKEIEAIWGAKGYHWDGPQRRFTVVR
ncbi:MAG TPA: helix-turn-helix transcriptional regulator [Geobacteraceae bacterium]